MKLSRKIIGFAVAATMFATQFTGVMAADTAAEMGNGTDNNPVGVRAGNEGQGNLIINSVDKVVVPTALRFVLNPKSYEVIIRYNEVDNTSAAAATGVKYYLKTVAGKYTPLDITDASDISANLPTGFGTQSDTTYDGKVYAVTPKNGTTYTDTSEAQVISLNYGIMNKSTADKIVSASFRIDYTEKSDGGTYSPVKFVENATKATYGNNAGNAGKNDLNLFLQVRTAKDDATVKAREAYVRATKTSPSFATSNVYYTYNADSTTAAATPYVPIPADTATTPRYAITSGKPGQFDAVGDLEDAIKAFNGDVFVLQKNAAGIAITPDTIGSQLSDVAISAFVTAGDSPQTFVQDDTPTADASHKVEGRANAAVTYELLQAKYVNRDGMLPDWTAQDLSDEGIMYCSEVNAKGFTGFTFAGVMNSQVDWNRADTTALKIVPRYTIRDIADGETTEAVGDASNGVGKNQKVIATGPSVSTTGTIDGSAVVINYNLGTGTLAATAVSSVDWGPTNKGDSGAVPANYYAVDTTANTITLTADYMGLMLGGGYTSVPINVTFDNGAIATVTLTN
jgi:hypothetical protein